MKCNIQDCDKAVKARGMCQSHYSKRYHMENKSANAVRHKIWRENHPEQFSKQQARYRANNPDKERDRHWRRMLKQYGLTSGQYNDMLASQGNKCAICGIDATIYRNGLVVKDSRGRGPRRFAVDHDHATNRVRGLLCNRCNQGLGMFKEDGVILGKAIRYLDSRTLLR